MSVNGTAVTTLGTNVGAKDRIEVDGKRVLVEDPIYRLLLKPRACLSTLAPTGPRPTLGRYIKEPEPGLQVVAPLDFPSEGVVLLTSDGALAEAMLKRGKVVMTYHLKLQGLVGEDDAERLRRGWRFEGRFVKPASVDRLEATEKNTWIEMVVVGTAAARAQGGGRRHPAFVAEDLARPAGRPVVRGAGDGRLARSDQERDLGSSRPRRPRHRRITLARATLRWNAFEGSQSRGDRNAPCQSPRSHAR